jgi:hypothetical protein
MPLLFAVLASVLALAAPARAEDVGKVDSIEAEDPNASVRATGPAGVRLIHTGDAVWQSDRIATDENETVHLVLTDGSEIMVGPSSEVAVDDVRTTGKGTALRMVYGILHAVVKHVYSDYEPFTVETPSGLMGVRGTEFILEHYQDAGETNMHTLEGNVAMAKTREDLRTPGKFQLVPAGNRSMINRAMRLPQPPQHFDPQKLVDRLAQNHPKMNFDKVHQSMAQNPRYQGKFKPPATYHPAGSKPGANRPSTPPRRVQHGPKPHAPNSPAPKAPHAVQHQQHQPAHHQAAHAKPAHAPAPKKKKHKGER